MCGGCGWGRLVPSMCFATMVVPVWLHPGCDSDLSADFRNFALVIFRLNILLKGASKLSFLCFGVEIRFGAPISDTVARSSIVFCNLVSADRIVMAASRLLGAAAACAILLSFAVEDCKSYWSGCIQAAIVICQQIFTLLTLLVFLFKNPFKSASKSSFFCFGVEIRFWSCYCRRR